MNFQTADPKANAQKTKSAHLPILPKHSTGQKKKLSCSVFYQFIYEILLAVFLCTFMLFYSCENKSNDSFDKIPTTEVERNVNVDFERIVTEGGFSNENQQRIFQELASLFSNKQKDKTEALKLYQKYIEYFEQQNDDAAIGKINRLVGNLLCKEYNFDTGIPYLIKSSENFTKARDYNSLCKAYNNLSLAYHDFGDYEKGIAYANLVLKNYQEHTNEINENLMWYAYNNLGINYDESKQYANAIESHLKALPFALNASDSSYSYNNLGNTYKKLNQYQQAKHYFTLSFKHSHDYEDMYHFATLYSNLMDIERLFKNYTQAENYIDSANFYALKSGSPEKLIDFYFYTHLLKSETTDYKSATQYLNKHIALKDSLLNAEKAKIVYDYQIKYETEKKEKQIAESKLASKQKNIWLILLGGGMIIGLVVFRNFSIKSKHRHYKLSLENELLKEQINAKIQEQRLEISRDLHDSLGAQLTLINSIIESLKNTAPKLDEAVNSKINTLSDFSENSIAELKNTLWVLNSDEIHLQDLKAKILNFIRNASEAKDDLKFNFNFDVSTNSNFNSKQAVNLFRTVQEIINNVIKYSDASEIIIDVQEFENILTIKISDNGKGFEFEKEKNKSFGLINIESRIKAINGTVHLETTKGKGTAYTIQIAI